MPFIQIDRTVEINQSAGGEESLRNVLAAITDTWEDMLRSGFKPIVETLRVDGEGIHEVADTFRIRLRGVK